MIPIPAHAPSRRGLLAAALAVAGAETAAGSRARAAARPVRLGVMAGPEEDIANVASGVAASRGVAVRLVTFEDYTLPNEALADGDIDANAFQHRPYLDAQIAARGYRLAALGLTTVEPMGFFSKRFRTVAALPDGARVAVQNDPSNQGRALNLLAAHGLVALAPGRGLLPSLADVTASPRHLDLVELDAAQLPRSLDDVAMASVNGNYAVAAGLDPKTALIREVAANNPYGNLLVARAADRDRPDLRVLLAGFQSDAVRAYLGAHFDGAILPAW